MMDKLPNLSPHLVTHPVALAAVGVIAVIFLSALGASWYAYLIVFLILIAVFAALIRYPHLRMEGDHLYNAATREDFKGFRSDATERIPSQPGTHSNLDALRVEEYERNCGLFLVHRWRSSEKQGQVADVIIRLKEHRDTSTRPSVLEEGKVESVRYELGRRFFEEPVLKHNSRDDFSLEVSAYHPVLCLAEVRFNDGHDPVRLSRYIDFPAGLQERPNSEGPQTSVQRYWRRRMFGG